MRHARTQTVTPPPLHPASRAAQRGREPPVHRRSERTQHPRTRHHPPRARIVCTQHLVYLQSSRIQLLGKSRERHDVARRLGHARLRSQRTHARTHTQTDIRVNHSPRPQPPQTACTCPHTFHCSSFVGTRLHAPARVSAPHARTQSTHAPPHYPDHQVHILPQLRVLRLALHRPPQVPGALRARCQHPGASLRQQAQREPVVRKGAVGNAAAGRRACQWGLRAAARRGTHWWRSARSHLIAWLHFESHIMSSTRSSTATPNASASYSGSSLPDLDAAGAGAREDVGAVGGARRDARAGAAAKALHQLKPVHLSEPRVL